MNDVKPWWKRYPWNTVGKKRARFPKWVSEKEAGPIKLIKKITVDTIK